MPMQPYQSKVRWEDKYAIVGFISSGTYGRVYKAMNKDGLPGIYAIKKFKPDKEGEQIQYTGISQSAIREMSLCQELHHPNISHHVETILQDKCIFMIFEYAEHDLLQLIHHHTSNPRRPLPASIVKSVMYQLINGVCYLHHNWVMHRDLKPANILVSSSGQVRIGDLGLARIFEGPLQALYTGDKVVVTIWYRAPELLLGARHYTPAIDMWAVGCIFAELLALRPIFKGEEAKMDSKKQVPFQRNQMQKIVEIMGLPTTDRWPKLTHHPEYNQLQSLAYIGRDQRHDMPTTGLQNWYNTTLKNGGYSEDGPAGHPGEHGFDLMSRLLDYDPETRLTAEEALQHPYFFANGENPGSNCFEGVDEKYPHRKVSHDDNDPSIPGAKRAHVPHDAADRQAKRHRD